MTTALQIRTQFSQGQKQPGLDKVIRANIEIESPLNSNGGWSRVLGQANQCNEYLVKWYEQNKATEMKVRLKINQGRAQVELRSGKRSGKTKVTEIKARSVDNRVKRIPKNAINRE